MSARPVAVDVAADLGDWVTPRYSDPDVDKQQLRYRFDLDLLDLASLYY